MRQHHSKRQGVLPQLLLALLAFKGCPDSPALVLSLFTLYNGHCRYMSCSPQSVRDNMLCRLRVGSGCRRLAPLMGIQACSRPRVYPAATALDAAENCRPCGLSRAPWDCAGPQCAQCHAHCCRGGLALAACFALRSSRAVLCLTGLCRRCRWPHVSTSCMHVRACMPDVAP